MSNATSRRGPPLPKASAPTPLPPECQDLLLRLRQDPAFRPLMDHLWRDPRWRLNSWRPGADAPEPARQNAEWVYRSGTRDGRRAVLFFFDPTLEENDDD